jgi:predicted NBD/HSP70 family sugar kinase
MLVENEKVRGRIGQPMTPLSLNPAGAFSVGVKIGRRSVDAVLVDFRGAPVAKWRATYAAPLRGPTMRLAREAVERVTAGLSAAERPRIVGLGLAMPGQVHLWEAELGVERGALADWEHAAPAVELEAATGLPAQVHNDATAACAAELALGRGEMTANTLYVYIGSFVGGGVVVDGRLMHGGRGNAGAIGSMPMLARRAGEHPRQLIHEASLVFLEADLAAQGIDPSPVIDGTAEDAEAEAVFRAWCRRASLALARCAAAAASVIDFETVLIDGVLNPRWRHALRTATETAMDGFDLAGLSPVRFAEGALGADARMLGAAILPLHARFSPQPELLARVPAEDGPLAAQ